MIMPSRHFVVPQNVPGEEEALARGAMWVEVAPQVGPPFLLQCALGFAGQHVARGVWSAPEPEEIWAIAGGYAYQVDTAAPQRTSLLPLRPVVHVLQSAEALILAGFHDVWVRGRGDVLWQSPRLSWEGVTLQRLEDGRLHGTGWHMRSDRELPFVLDLRTRALTGGAFLP